MIDLLSLMVNEIQDISLLNCLPCYGLLILFCEHSFSYLGYLGGTWDKLPFFFLLFFFCQTLFPPSICLVSWEVLRELMESYGLILDKDVNNVQSYRWDFLKQKHAVVVHMKFHWDKIWLFHWGKIWLSTSSYLFSLGKLWQMTISQSEVSVRTRHIHHNEIN